MDINEETTPIPTSKSIKRKYSINAYFKPTRIINSSSSLDISSLNEAPLKSLEQVDLSTASPLVFDPSKIERDPGLRSPIWAYHVNQRDEVRRAYIMLGAYQPKLKEYPLTQSGIQQRRFSASWFAEFPWLEYSLHSDKVFCFPCFLFESNPPKRPAFTSDGFNSWKRVHDGKHCSFLQHVGLPCSPHASAMNSCEHLGKPTHHIDKVINSQSKEEILKNRLRLRTTIESVRWLAFQGCAFRGDDESENSINRGNVIEFIKHLASKDDKVNEVVLGNAPGNAKYIAPSIQKQILNLFAKKVRNKIRDDVGDAKFCILVDEAQDISNREQMALVLRFVDSDGYVQERFFAIVGIDDTFALTLKKELTNVLSLYGLHLSNMRGQGYDGASNMRGKWNGLQALFLKDSPSAYYIHCFAHQLQLALVASAQRVGHVWLFFSKLSCIVNLVGVSAKRHTELRCAQKDEIARMVACGERDTGKGKNQIGSLQRAGATRWSSHFRSVNRLVDMFDASCSVLENIMKNGSGPTVQGQALGAFQAIRSFEFVFILLLLNKVMGITELLCQALQQKNQDILNAMNLVSTTKTLLRDLRQDGWDTFYDYVDSFCTKNDIIIPDPSAPYLTGTSRSCQQNDSITIKHRYKMDIFNAMIDFQVMDLEDRFPETTIELLVLSTALDPRDSYKSFNIDHICSLAEKFYPTDFTTQDICALRVQLQHYKIDVLHHSDFQNISTMSELCRRLVESKKSNIYTQVDKIIRLVLTLPVSTASSERAFSAMKLLKTQLRNKMEDEFLADLMTIYIERELAQKIDIESIIDDFYAMKKRRVQL